MADYERAVKALSLMMAANSRGQLLQASEDVDILVSLFVLPSVLGDASTALPQHLEPKKLLQLMCSAYATVIDLVTGPLHEDFTAAFVLRLTSVLLTSVGVMLEEGTDSITGHSAPEKLSKAQLISWTGLITALTAACAKFAKQLKKHTANHDMVYSVAVTTLHTVNILMRQWPGKHVLGRVFPPLLLPATRLALVMTQLPNPADAATQSSGSKKQATAVPSRSQLDVEHLLFAGNLMDALQGDILHVKQADFLLHVSAVQHVLESRDVLELCVAAFATQVRKLYIDKQSSPDSTAHATLLSSGGRAGARSCHPEKLHSAVAASHDKVLAILGCKNTKMLHGHLAAVHTINCSAHALYQLLTYRMRLPHPACPKKIGQRPPLPLPTWEAVLLLYVELQLLVPTAETVIVAQESIYHMYASSTTNVECWRAEFQAAGRGLSAAVAEAMLLLVPSAIKVAKQEANSSGDQTPEKILESYRFSLVSVLATTLKDSIAGVLQKQPETAAAALEMAVRGVPIDTWIDTHMLGNFLGAMRRVLEACSAVVKDQHSGLEINAAQQSQRDRPLLQLALSCLKCLRSILQAPTLAMNDMQQAVACVNQCVLLAVSCEPFSESGGVQLAVDEEPQHMPHTAAASAPPLSFTASDSSNSELLPLVAAARGLEMLGCCFGKLLHACEASDLLARSKVATDLQMHLYTCCGYVVWVKWQLWMVEMPALDDTTRTTLVDMCQGIGDTISSQSQQGLSSAGTVANMLRDCQRIARAEAMAAELGPKLQLLGTEVCSVLPISSCCSNHQCVNTAHYTEQQLVGGKVNLCSGCRTARYCSAACQKQHWSKHHRAVCNTIKQARQRSSASGGAQVSARGA